MLVISVCWMIPHMRNGVFRNGLEVFQGQEFAIIALGFFYTKNISLYHTLFAPPPSSLPSSFCFCFCFFPRHFCSCLFRFFSVCFCSFQSCLSVSVSFCPCLSVLIDKCIYSLTSQNLEKK